MSDDAMEWSVENYIASVLMAMIGMTIVGEIMRLGENWEGLDRESPEMREYIKRQLVALVYSRSTCRPVDII